MTIMLYAFNCISDGLAGSQRTLVGSLMGLVRYPYMRIYIRSWAPLCTPYALQLRTVEVPLHDYRVVCIQLHLRWSGGFSTDSCWVSYGVGQVPVYAHIRSWAPLCTPYALQLRTVEAPLHDYRVVCI
jgi:hypothetical protein